MPEFSAERYKKRLLKSQSCDTCEKVPLPKLNEKTRYIFISYSHKDYKKVYCDLADLHESGIPFWYDGGLPAGKNWDDVVREKMTDSRCSGVLFFLSENLFLSRSIQTEIRIACGEDGDPSTPRMKRDYFCINLTDKSPSGILKSVYPAKQFPDAEDEMEAQEDWANTLRKAFPDKSTFLPFHNPNHKTNLLQQINLVFGINPNYNTFDFGGAMFRSGSGVIEFRNGAIYEGAFLNGMFDGKGVLTSSDGDVYKGEWTEGKRHGRGTMTYSDGAVYTGEWSEGKHHGRGTMTVPDGAVYKGEWSEGKRHGRGTMTYSNGITYKGDWVNGKRHGRGALTVPNGGDYTGEWAKGLPHGQGTMTYSDGVVYEGGWGENGPSGYGRYIYPDGALRCGIWDGEILLEGVGILRYPDGSSYDGQIKNNLRHGQGTYIRPDGTKQTGRFEKGIFLGPGK